MSDSTLVLPLESPATDRAARTRLPIIVGIVSCASLLLELSLTRLFSVVLFYHFAFLAISVALLGLGAGGVLAYVFKGWFQKFSTRDLAATLCLGQAVLIPIVLFIVLHVPVSLELSQKN